MQAGASTDPFYLRFTTPQAKGLILGSSRAAQGIIPEVVDSLIGGDDLFNFAFTNANSPYGPVYYKAIQRKLSPETENGTFILEVSPWILSCIGDADKKPGQFREQGTMLDDVYFLNSSPNPGYLLKAFQGHLYTLWINEEQSFKLSQSGWLEITVPMDSTSVKTRTEKKLSDYESLTNYHISTIRMEYLMKTIELLQNHGDVFLVRAPVHPLILDVENHRFPDFENQISKLALSEGLPYFSLVADGDKYDFTDGNHLWKGSSRIFSQNLAERIAQSRASE